jgi:serine phosphatase RsbU (regulator of sigma subunit)/anti-sigma regulatory factor (Ser/Thr protein kinase)
MRPLNVLSVDDDPTLGLLLKTFIRSLGHECTVVADGERALQQYRQTAFDLVLMDQLMPGMGGIAATGAIRELQKLSGWRPIIMLSGLSETDDQVASLDAGCDDFIAKPVNFAILAAKINAFGRIVMLQEQVAEQNRQLLQYRHAEAEERRISRFLMSRLVRSELLDHPQVRYLLQPANEVSGDLLLACPSSNGDLYVMLADATGHGLPAALTLIPLSQAFYAMAGKGFTLDSIAWELNLRHRAYSPVDRFVAALLVQYRPRENLLTVWNGGVPAALLLDPQGAVVRRFNSLNLPLGIADGDDFENLHETVAVEPGQRLLLYSDGLIEAENAAREPFGKARLEQCLQQPAPGDLIDSLQQALLSHMDGRQPHDDLSCLLLECCAVEAGADTPVPQAGGEIAENWHLQLSFGVTQLQRLDLAPIVAAQCNTLGLAAEKQGALAVILYELLSNALDHGLLGLNSAMKNLPDGFEQYFETRRERLAALTQGEIRVEVRQQGNADGNSLQVRVCDSGKGFDIERLPLDLDQDLSHQYHGRGLILVRSLCQRLVFYPPGNSVKAELAWAQPQQAKADAAAPAANSTIRTQHGAIS